jgi:hypothetical protein
VWLVRELVDRCELSKREDAQDCFVLAVTAIEAAGIVGEDERRRIIRVEEVCPISKLPDDKYKVVACTPNDRTERRGTATLENQKPYGTT